jgi:hypothetical protein
VALGVGGRARGYGFAAIVTLLCIPMVLLMGAYALIALGLLLIAVWQRNRYLALWAVAFGVVGSLESIGFFDNRLFQLNNAMGLYKSSGGYFSWATPLVYAVLGAALIVGGLYARRQEVDAA